MFFFFKKIRYSKRICCMGNKAVLLFFWGHSAHDTQEISSKICLHEQRGEQAALKNLQIFINRYLSLSNPGEYLKQKRIY